MAGPFAGAGWRLTLVAIGLACWAAVAHAATDWPGRQWQSGLLTGHPLAGIVWDVRARRSITPNQLRAALKIASMRLIGEVHDNPDHHRIQAWLIADTHAPGQGSVVFEHIRADQVDALSTFAALAPAERTPAKLFDLLAWEQGGWPARALFVPLFDAVVSKGLAIVPGEAARDKVRQLARQGADAIDPVERARLGLAEELPEPEQSALLDELEASHCGLMPRTAFAGMALAQRYRDAHLARAMIDAAANGPVTLVTGNGHVNAGRGVPWHLARLAPNATVVTVAIIEVAEGKTDAAAAVPKDAAGKPVADYAIFTPVVDREDPCVGMRRAFAPKRSKQ